MPPALPKLRTDPLVSDAPASSEAVEFDALEYTADDTFSRSHLRFGREPGGGWRIERDGHPHLELGEGYRLLRTLCCGVCSTDLDRRFLPFPLPQVIGHEIVARDEAGARFVVEINASHHARGLAAEGGSAACAFCASGLEHHCPERLVLGIHDLPGGFGPWVLVPERALVAVPDALPDATAALVEPFAAALHAVTTLDPGNGDRVAVLGPGRLGLLAIAALAAWRRATGRSFEIVALGRGPRAFGRAEALGADRCEVVEGRGPAREPVADIVLDTSGSPEGFATALGLAAREVHLKSTHGQPAVGLAHLTEAVVDELAIEGIGLSPARSPETPRGRQARSIEEALASIEPMCRSDLLCVGWLGDMPSEATAGVGAIEWVQAADARSLLEAVEVRPANDPRQTLPRVDAVVVREAAEIDSAIRPDPTREASPVRPGGRILVRSDAPSRAAPARSADTGPIAEALARGLRISTSRCGDFHAAVELLAGDAQLRRLGDLMVSHRYPASALAEAFACARSPSGLKVLVEHAPHDGA